MEQLKKHYNELLARYKKAEVWMDDPKRTLKEKEKYFKDFMQVVDGLNAILKELKEKGVEVTGEEVINGFKTVQNSET